MNKMSKKASEFISKNFVIYQEKPENAFTVEDVAKQTGLLLSQASSRLNEMARMGKVKSGKFKRNGKVLNYYIPS